MNNINAFNFEECHAVIAADCCDFIGYGCGNNEGYPNGDGSGNGIGDQEHKEWEVGNNANMGRDEGFSIQFWVPR